MTRSNRSTCCCCIPIRYGVTLIALNFLLGALMVGTFIFVTLTHQGLPGAVNLDSRSMRKTFIIAGIQDIFLATSSLVGLIGAMYYKPKYVAFYAYFLWGYLVFDVLTGIRSIAQFPSAETLTQRCQDDLKEKMGESGQREAAADACKLVASVAKNSIIAFAAISVIFQTYCAIVVQRYARLLVAAETHWEVGQPPVHDNDAEWHSMPIKTDKIVIPSKGGYLPLQSNPQDEVDAPHTCKA